MLQRLCLALAAILAFSGPATAQSLPERIAAEAAGLKDTISADLAQSDPGGPAQPLSPELVSRLQRLSLDTARLSTRIEEDGGPKDLRCIFRGMSADIDRNLRAAEAASSRPSQSQALERLAYTLSDAAQIAPAAEGFIEGGPSTPHTSCPAQD